MFRLAVPRPSRSAALARRSDRSAPRVARIAFCLSCWSAVRSVNAQPRRGPAANTRAPRAACRTSNISTPSRRQYLTRAHPTGACRPVLRARADRSRLFQELLYPKCLWQMCHECDYSLRRLPAAEDSRNRTLPLKCFCSLMSKKISLIEIHKIVTCFYYGLENKIQSRCVATIPVRAARPSHWTLVAEGNCLGRSTPLSRSM
jgi:hypothetical protein